MMMLNERKVAAMCKPVHLLHQTVNPQDLDWECCLPADPQVFPSVRHAAIEACRSVGASETDCLALDLALGEALANAVSHGRHSLTAAQPIVSLRLWRYHDRLIFEIRDNGPGFDPPLPPYSMPEDMTLTHGRGLPLMQGLTDALLVSRGDSRTGGSIIYLIKHLSQN
jgi:anti-sigma regulatory factor (Ser/Thr protein kinase)